MEPVDCRTWKPEMRQPFVGIRKTTSSLPLRLRSHDTSAWWDVLSVETLWNRLLLGTVQRLYEPEIGSPLLCTARSYLDFHFGSSRYTIRGSDLVE